MATVVTYNPERTQEIVDGTVIDGSVNGSGKLMLEYRNGAVLDAGTALGPQGFQGPGKPPPGAQITLFAGSVAPQGWLFCDGATISRVNFPELFAILGTTYGAGDGSGTTFNLPDFRGRVAVGLDAAQSEFNVLAKQGGEKTHILTPSEMPAHTHGVLGYSGWDDKNFTGNVGRFNAADTYGQGNTTYDKPTGSVGGGAAHNNLQPYSTINYIISTATSNLGVALAEGGGIAAPRYFTKTERGTTAERDAKYGVPGNAAARVALANQKIVWYNTDLGWDESYYEVTGSAGLTVLGLVAGATAGWFPISEGPYIDLIGTHDFNAVINAFVGGWSIYRRKGGASWFTQNGTDRVNVLQHGRYDIKVWTNQYGGSTLLPDFAFQVLATDNVTLVRNIGGGAFQKITNLMTRPHMEAYDNLILPNQKVGFKLQRGTLPGGDTNMMVNSGDAYAEPGHLIVKYVGPPLSDIE